jgi:hypothetical protein
MISNRLHNCIELAYGFRDLNIKFVLRVASWRPLIEIASQLFDLLYQFLLLRLQKLQLIRQCAIRVLAGQSSGILLRPGQFLSIAVFLN